MTDLGESALDHKNKDVRNVLCMLSEILNDLGQWFSTEVLSQKQVQGSEKGWEQQVKNNAKCK